jgi:hypothetical protein
MYPRLNSARSRGEKADDRGRGTVSKEKKARVRARRGLPHAVAFKYMVERARILPIGDAGKLSRDDNGSPQVTFPGFGDDGSDLTLPLEGWRGDIELTDKTEGCYTIVKRPDGSYSLLAVVGGDSQEERERKSGKLLVDFVRKEVGKDGFAALVDRFLEYGPGPDATQQPDPKKLVDEAVDGIVGSALASSPPDAFARRAGAD